MLAGHAPTQQLVSLHFALLTKNFILEGIEFMQCLPKYAQLSVTLARGGHL